MRRKLLTCILAISLFLSIVSIAQASGEIEDIAILIALDSSGSMNSEDPDGFWLDAIVAAIDLSPQNTNMALLAVSNTVVASTEFVDISERQNRDKLITTAQGVAIQGNTDFSAAFYAGVDLFESRHETNKHIVLIGDIGESGFFRPRDGYAAATERLAELTDKLSDMSIHVHLVFIGTPSMNEQFMPLWDDLVYRTDGSMIFVDQPQQLPQTIQSLYFGLFEYTKTITTAINTTDIPKEIQIRLPDFEPDRVRIHVSSTEPIEGIQFRADSGDISFNETRLHATIELRGEMPETATLVLPPNIGTELSIVTIIDGTVPEPYYVTYEEAYIPIPPIDIPLAEAPPEPIPVAAPFLSPMAIAVIIFCALIAIALIIFFLIRKKEAPPVVVTPISEGNRFYGKLSVYSLTIDGGERELRPFDFPLQTLQTKAVTLREIMNSVGATDIFAGSQDIVFSVGAGESIIVSNNSAKAAIRMMGRDYGFQTKIQMFYGQKIYIKLNSKNELEISFRTSPEPIGGSHQVKMSLRADNQVHI